jgi:hypothetical protein
VYSVTKDDVDPIIMLGDFNVNGRRNATDHNDSDEYLHMLDILKGRSFVVRDLLKEVCGFHPPTVGDYIEENGRILAREIHLTNPVDQKLAKRLDYIFWVERTEIKEEEEKQIPPFVQPDGCSLVHLFIDPSISGGFTQLSDHYGVEAIMKLSQ